MKKRNRRGGLAKAVAFALSLSLSSSMMVSLPSFAAQEPINASLPEVFGQVATYDEAQGIGLVWGAVGYDLYTVTIS